MKITGVETYWTQTPFDMGGKPKVMGGLNWQNMNTVWLRIRTDAGIDGWGEAFGHGTAAGTLAVLDTQLAPALLGQDARDIAGLRRTAGESPFTSMAATARICSPCPRSTSPCGTSPAKPPTCRCGVCLAVPRSNP